MKTIDIQQALKLALSSVTKDFVTTKRRAYGRNQRGISEADIRHWAAREKKDKKNKIKQATYEILPTAYNLASANGTLPANARQIMYAARPLVQKLTGGKCWDNSSYFTQQLLPNFIEEFPEMTADWDVVYDARGHFAEPHVKQRLGLGTLNVRDYINKWTDDPDTELEVEINNLYPTSGPKHRYKFALFIEKEGFNPLFEKSKIAERFDIAIFSSKGHSTTATRNLVDNLSQNDVTILILHDLDIEGMGISHVLSHNTRRYTFDRKPVVIDLGLRLVDVEAMDLQSETWEKVKLEKDPRHRLRRYGATPEECDFIVDENNSGFSGWTGKRVELNAMSSSQLITWLEEKLIEHGVTKHIPDSKTLTKAYRRARDIKRLRQTLEEILVEPDESAVPEDLEKQVRGIFANEPAIPWDEALLKIVRLNNKPESESEQ